jgi:hypothetical protein
MSLFAKFADTFLFSLRLCVKNYPMDSKIFSAAAFGFSAAQIGRPITSQLAPAAMASRGVIVRF